MILRRIAEGIRNQDWFVVIVEIMIVVVGIFIGLQVDDWNNARKDRVDEREYLQSIHDEIGDSLIFESGNLENTLERRRILFEAVEIISGRVEVNELSPQQCDAVYRGNAAVIFLSDVPSLESMITQGRIDIIRNKELRDALLGYSQLKSTTERVVGGTLSLSRKYPEIIHATLEAVDDTRALSIPHCDLAAMRASPTFQNDFIENARRQIVIFRIGIIPLLESIENIHTLLDAGLRISHDS